MGARTEARRGRRSPIASDAANWRAKPAGLAARSKARRARSIIATSLRAKALLPAVRKKVSWRSAASSRVRGGRSRNFETARGRPGK